MRLYEHPESGNSHKIRLLLSFLGLEYESVVVDLMTDEQHQEPFLSINPRRGPSPQIPTSQLLFRLRWVSGLTSFCVFFLSQQDGWSVVYRLFCSRLTGQQAQPDLSISGTLHGQTASYL